MTTYDGQAHVEPIREPEPHARPARPGTAGRELPARARAAAGGPPLGRAEGALEPRGGRPGGRVVRGPHAPVPARPAVLRPRRPPAVPAAALGGGRGAAGARRAIAAATTPDREAP